MLREAMETQRLPLMTADNPIAFRARGGAGARRRSSSSAPAGYRKAVSPMETSLFFFILFLGQTPIRPGVQRPQFREKERECRYRSLVLRCFPRDPGAGRVRAGWAAPRSHRISIRMNFPYAAAKKTDGKTIRPTIPAQTLPRDSGSDRFWGAEMISVTVW